MKKLINLAVTLAVLAVFTVPGYFFIDWIFTAYDNYPNPRGPAVARADKVKDDPRRTCLAGEIYKLAEGYEKDTLQPLRKKPPPSRSTSHNSSQTALAASTLVKPDHMEVTTCCQSLPR